jgi:ABC-type polysaccharide/polyol phosphate export permease
VVKLQVGSSETLPEAESRIRYRVWQSNSDYTAWTIWDLSEAARRGSLWGRLAWQDVLLRYRRSALGPFWLTLSMGLMVGALGIIYGDLFKVDMNDYLPYLTVSLLIWNLIQSCISDGCQTFIEAEWIIRQINLPLSMFPFRVVCRNIIIFAHNLVIYLAILLIFPIHVGWVTLAAIPGLLLLLVNALWCSTLLGMLSARFRDLPQIVASILQIAFFATPVIWRVNLINNKLLVDLNPFYHFIELVRAPLLGQSATLVSWLVVAGITIVGCVSTFLFYRSHRTRIAFWI